MPRRIESNSRYATACRTVAAVAFSLLAFPVIASSQSAGAAPADKYIWLEDATGARSMEWVHAEDAKTAKVLEADPHYAPFLADALKIAEDPRRLPDPASLEDGEVYNVWRDKDHPRGLFRKTSLESYPNAEPHWQTLIDFDALGKAEHKGWVPRGRSCLYPGNQLCLIGLSDGGEDATTEREFNLKTGQFVPSGFVLPHSKQDTTWVDSNTLLVGRDWGAGTMTSSGYPFVVKEWKRGTPLESAREFFRGEPTDVSAGCTVLHDAQSESLTMCRRGVTFFESKYFVQTPQGLRQLAIPLKSDVAALLDGRILVQLRENWRLEGQAANYPEGSLLELKLTDVLKDAAHLKPAVVFAPTQREFLQEVATVGSHLLLTTLDNVQGKAYRYDSGPQGWTRKQLPLPNNIAVSIVSASNTSENYFLRVTGFLTPPTLYLGNAGSGSLKESKSEPARFDASQESVDQYEATSKDGTKVPYFVVHPKSWKLDGNNPTLLNAYGGFEVAETPSYSAARGKLWLEKGGVFVLANIRGGGEFGPAWHEAGLKTHRQVIYDDFSAVGQDLIARKITSPRHLGIIGGSNGGLLMGVEMTQHPDLWHGVVIQIPLLDMLRFEQIAAGASWVGEYGSVKNPDERAFLAGISPYNQLKPGVHYPTPLIFTTTKDDRVGPQHARKFAAKMEEYKEPFFYDEITEGGHGAGASIQQEATTSAVTYTYLARELD